MYEYINTLQINGRKVPYEVSYCHSSNSRCFSVYSTTIFNTLT